MMPTAQQLKLINHNHRLNQTKRPNHQSTAAKAVSWIAPAPLFYLIISLFTLALLLTSPVSFAKNNILQNHSSPYLAMHGSDPVDWRLWNSDILKQAQQENKLIFISSGYFSCHWCHVMQKENYKHPLTAEYLNKHFINVKIDRELNPELDKTLIEFAQKSTGQAGWPQHVVLTPSGYPFVAFIYLPNENFQKTLKRITELWQTQANRIEAVAKKAALAKPPTTQAVSTLQFSKTDFIDKLFKQLNQHKDDFAGGLQATSKFPNSPLLKNLVLLENLPSEIEDWLQLTLDQMQNEHLFDHINGGFYRYTVDPNWQTPHFEKMAYDNALLAEVYLLAGKRWNNKSYASTAKQTLDYMRLHLFDKTNQLYRGSQSAIDKQDREGGDYIWSNRALKQVLTPLEYQLLEIAWLMKDPPPYELGWHPKPVAPEATWQKIRSKLQTDPFKIPTDTKSLLGWNGLMLSTLSRAAIQLPNSNYQQQAKELAQQLSKLISFKNPPRALSKNRTLLGEANLQDYAFIRQGLLDYQHLLNDVSFKPTVELIEQRLTENFFGSKGWKYDATPILPQQTGDWIMDDGPIPSPTALVSCLKPQSLVAEQQLVMAQALYFSSYINVFDCIQTPSNPVK